MSYDKDKVKEALSDEDVFELLSQLGAEPEDRGDYYICKTICHGGSSHKLYYYLTTRLCKCYTHCGDAFDIFELIQKVTGGDLNDAIIYVVNMFNLSGCSTEETDEDREEWKAFEKYQELTNIKVSHEKIILPEIDPHILDHYPQPRLLDWEKEGISKAACDYMNIRYDPVDGNILIPHYDENGRMIGIRTRTLVQENEKWGKYRPWRYGKKQYNHPLAFNCFGLNIAKDNIRDMKIAIVVESEKAILQILDFLGASNTVAVAVCGSSISQYQFNLLQDLGINEMCIAFDADYHTIGDDDFNKVIERWQRLYNKFSAFVQVSFLFDREGNKLGYKDSPTDKGKDVFMELWRDRVFL